MPNRLSKEKAQAIAAEPKKLTAKEETAVTAYTAIGSDTYNNWAKSYTLAGYSTGFVSWQVNAMRVHSKGHVQAAIAAKRAEKAEKYEWDEQKALERLDTAHTIACNEKQASAIVSGVAVANRMFGLEKPALPTGNEHKPHTAMELEVLARLAHDYKMAMSRRVESRVLPPAATAGQQTADSQPEGTDTPTGEETA